MRRYYFLPVLLLGCLLGIYAARFSTLSSHACMIALVLALLVAVRFRRLAFAPCLLLGLGLGVLRAEPLLDGYRVLEDSRDEKVSLTGTIVTDPVYHASGQYEFNIEKIGFGKDAIDAKMRIRAYVADVQRGDRVKVQGKLRDGFASWQASVYFANVERISRDDTWLAAFRGSFIANTYSSIPDPEASLGLGFLMGIRSLLPEQLEDELRTTGLTHIVAVSGYNLTILAMVSRRVLHRFSRFQAAVLTIVLVALFVSITGFSPSIVRAVIVSGLSIGAWYYGRNVGPWSLLLYSSALSAMWQPSYAWFNVGWYLSLSAFFGVLVMAPMLQRLVYKNKQPGLLQQILIETTTAQAATMPIIMMVFGEVSAIALLANMLVLPLIPVTMLMTFAAGMAYYAGHAIAFVFAFPSYIILQFITSVVSILSNVSWALVTVSITATQLVILYVACVAVCLLGQYRSRHLV